MPIRQIVALALTVAPVCATAQSVVELPGVHASVEAGCVEPDHAASAALSYPCLNRMMAADSPSPALPAIGADVSKQPTNAMGLYNASGLRNRMGQNLGTSVHPYRPTVTYPTPLATPGK